MYKWVEKISSFFYNSQLLYIKILGGNVGKNVRVYGRIHIKGHPKNLTIGDNVTLNEGVLLNCRDRLVIEKNCRLSAYTRIFTASLTIDQTPRKHKNSPVTLHENVWLASGVVVSAGVIIGENSIVTSNAVVLENIPKNCMFGGIPAKFIKEINIK